MQRLAGPVNRWAVCGACTETWYAAACVVLQCLLRIRLLCGSLAPSIKALEELFRSTNSNKRL